MHVRSRWAWVAVAMVIALAAVVFVWFQPQKLLVDDVVDDALPAATSPPREPTAAAEPAELAELARGSFISRDHDTTGVVRVLRLGDGSRIVRLEGLATDNGPDLYLYLSPNAADGQEGAFDDGHLSLGRLKGNLGDQNYDLPAGADLASFRSVVIWCDRFDAAFGAASLT